MNMPQSEWLAELEAQIESHGVDAVQFYIIVPSPSTDDLVPCTINEVKYDGDNMQIVVILEQV